MATINRQSILERLRTVIDPELKRDVVSLDFVRDLEIEDPTVKLSLVVNTPLTPTRIELQNAARESLLGLTGVESVEVKLRAEIPKSRATDGNQPVEGISNIVPVRPSSDSRAAFCSSM